MKLQNKLACGRKGGWTRDFTTSEITPLYYAAENYAASDTPAAVLAGKMYGSGSSRDWAAKGPMLLGVRVAIAESFERIHRSNLIGMASCRCSSSRGKTRRRWASTAPRPSRWRPSTSRRGCRARLS